MKKVIPNLDVFSSLTRMDQYTGEFINEIRLIEKNNPYYRQFEKQKKKRNKNNVS